MKIEKTISSYSIVCIFILLICFCGTTLAGPGPNSGTVPQGYKVKGPSPVAFLMAGWIPPVNECIDMYDCKGVLEAYIWVDGKLYMKLLDDEYPEYLIIEATVEDLIVHEDSQGNLTGWEFPNQIAAEYNFKEDARVVVLSEKDVTSSNEELVLEDVVDVDSQYVVYRHILRTELKLSFLISK